MSTKYDTTYHPQSKVQRHTFCACLSLKLEQGALSVTEDKLITTPIIIDAMLEKLSREAEWGTSRKPPGSLLQTRIARPVGEIGEWGT